MFVSWVLQNAKNAKLSAEGIAVSKFLQRMGIAPNAAGCFGYLLSGRGGMLERGGTDDDKLVMFMA